MGRPVSTANFAVQPATSAQVAEVERLWAALKTARFKGDRQAAIWAEWDICRIVGTVPGGVVVAGRRFRLDEIGDLEVVIERRDGVTPLACDASPRNREKTK